MPPGRAGITAARSASACGPSRGLTRTQSLRRARLQGQLLDWEQVSLQSEIYSEYTSALANYKSNLYNLY